MVSLVIYTCCKTTVCQSIIHIVEVFCFGKWISVVKVMCIAATTKNKTTYIHIKPKLNDFFPSWKSHTGAWQMKWNVIEVWHIVTCIPAGCTYNTPVYRYRSSVYWSMQSKTASPCIWQSFFLWIWSFSLTYRIHHGSKNTYSSPLHLYHV